MVRLLIQTVCDPPTKGNCFATSLACLLEVPIPSLPPATEDALAHEYDDWLRHHGLRCIAVSKTHLQAITVDTYFILIVKSAVTKGGSHAVVARGASRDGQRKVQIIWNPNPNDPRGTWIDDQDWIEGYLLIPMTPVSSRRHWWERWV